MAAVFLYYLHIPEQWSHLCLMHDSLGAFFHLKSNSSNHPFFFFLNFTFFFPVDCLCLNHVIFCLWEPVIKWACLHPLLLGGGGSRAIYCISLPSLLLCEALMNQGFLTPRLATSTRAPDRLAACSAVKRPAATAADGIKTIFCCSQTDGEDESPAPDGGGVSASPVPLQRTRPALQPPREPPPRQPLSHRTAFRQQEAEAAKVDDSRPRPDPPAAANGDPGVYVSRVPSFQNRRPAAKTPAANREGTAEPSVPAHRTVNLPFVKHFHFIVFLPR